MAESKGLFDSSLLALQALRRANVWPKHPLYRMAHDQLQERLADVKKPFGAHSTSAINLSGSYDLILSCLEQQPNANTIHDQLAKAYTHLTTGGLFLAVMTANQTLHELRLCLTEAEIALSGGAAPRFHPLPTIETISAAMTSSGFAHPVIDQERVQLAYPDIYALMHDLRACGFTNALKARVHHFSKRNLFAVANHHYTERFSSPNGGIAATVDLVFLHGWRE